jgi:hypothetical protein
MSRNHFWLSPIAIALTSMASQIIMTLSKILQSGQSEFHNIECFSEPARSPSEGYLFHSLATRNIDAEGGVE